MHILLFERLDNVMKLEQIYPLNKTSQLITRILKMCGQGLRREHGKHCMCMCKLCPHTHTQNLCVQILHALLIII